jgi:hypothetical protein
VGVQGEKHLLKVPRKTGEAGRKNVLGKIWVSNGHCGPGPHWLLWLL